MSRSPIFVCAALFVAALLSVGCGTFTVTREGTPGVTAAGTEVGFLGAYDSRVQLGGVKTHEQRQSVGAMPVYGSQGYAGTVYYPTTETVRTGEVEPNRVVDGVAKGFLEVSSGASVVDFSGSAPLETRTEMGMDWFAKHNKTPPYLVAVEVKDASVDLEEAQNTYKLGVAAITFGVLSPCLCFTTAPCLAYPLFAETQASATATGTVRVYDVAKGEVVFRAPVEVSFTAEKSGIFDPEPIFDVMSDELMRRFGAKAAEKALTHLASAR